VIRSGQLQLYPTLWDRAVLFPQSYHYRPKPKLGKQPPSCCCKMHEGFLQEGEEEGVLLLEYFPMHYTVRCLQQQWTGLRLMGPPHPEERFQPQMTPPILSLT
jgi:hypothetical protein